jgi:hypothetical protein
MAGSDSEYARWVHHSAPSSDDGIPVNGPCCKPEPEPADWRDIHDDLFGTQLSPKTPVQLDRCPFCGVAPLKEVPEHGHYRTECCKQVTVGCCNGETG